MRAVAVVIAVKRLDAAKTRLTPTIAADDRRALVLAMLTDTIAAARAAGAIAYRVGIVRDDHEGFAEALSDQLVRADVVVTSGGVSKGAYDVVKEVLQEQGIGTRVVSVPCMDFFTEQDQAYRDEVLPPAVRARVSVEAGIAQSWYRWIGDAGDHIGIEHYGASADYQTLYKEFGITTDAVVAAAQTSIAAAG